MEPEKKQIFERDRLIEAYDHLGRTDLPLPVREAALVTILTLDWGAEILARRPEFEARREAERAERARQKETQRLNNEARERATEEMRAHAREQHEQLMREDPNYALNWKREHPAR